MISRRPYILLDGELQATFRGEKRIVRAGAVSLTFGHDTANPFGSGYAGLGITLKIPKQMTVFSPERGGLGENKNRQEGPIEFATLTLPVPQVAAGGLVPDDLPYLRHLQRGNLKTVPTQQGRSRSVAARTGYADSNPRGDPQAHNTAGASACIGITRL